MPLPSLPIDAVAPHLRDAWERKQNFILTAPTGSGKSTRVPGMIADLAAGNGKIIVLQPRRMAAKWLARRVAAERATTVGESVGYQIRHESRMSAATRILFVTEGVLLRRLQGDPELSGVAALLFDEFHERHLQGDVGLAVAHTLQGGCRPDLRIGVMSATLETSGLEAFLAPAAIIHAEGRTFPVDIAFARASQLNRRSPIWEQATDAFRTEAKKGFSGDCLIFMPGVAEIHRTIESLRRLPESQSFDLHPLYGEMAPEAQDAVFGKGAQPKIIVSTNIAETSLTLPQVRLVIDSGQARIAGYDANRGLNTLLVEPISQASADQRAGRAGRVAPGRCFRLWTESEHAHRPRFLAPEIHRLDLAEILLALHASSLGEARRFDWFEPPATHRIEEAEALLQQLRAIDDAGELTPLGRRMAALPLHPRLSAIVLEAQAQGCLEEGCLLAALLEGRSLFVRKADEACLRRRDSLLDPAIDAGSDHLALLLAWQAAAHARFQPEWGRAHAIHTAAARQVGQTTQQLLRLLDRDARAGEKEVLTRERLQSILLAGFADNVARRLNPSNYSVETARGRNGEIGRSSLAREAEWIVATDMQERTAGREVSVFLEQNTPISLGLLRELFPEEFKTATHARLEGRQRRVVTVEETRFRSLTVESREIGEGDVQQAAEILAKAVISGELTLKHWNDRVEQWISRVNFLARTCPDYGFVPFTEEDRKCVIEQVSYGATAYSQLKDRPLQPFLDDWLPAGLASEVERLAPTEIVLGERKRFRLRYPEEGPPVASGQIQKFYDISHQHLAIADGRALPRIELLAPNQRPVQVTDHLDAFWGGSYPEIRKQLRGRYPKHEWR